MSPIPTVLPLAVGAVLFGLGLFCLAAHRSAIRILLGIELMLNASLLNFVVFSASFGDASGAAFAVMIMAVAAAEAAVGLSLVFALYATRNRSDMELTKELSQ